jgi:hypothetical protein
MTADAEVQSFAVDRPVSRGSQLSQRIAISAIAWPCAREAAATRSAAASRWCCQLIASTAVATTTPSIFDEFTDSGSIDEPAAHCASIPTPVPSEVM